MDGVVRRRREEEEEGKEGAGVKIRRRNKKAIKEQEGEKRTEVDAGLEREELLEE